MRKLLTGAVAAATMLALGGGAVVHAQTDGVVFTAKVSPADAGTKQKPKNTALTFSMKVDRPATTVEFIDLTLPNGLKFNAKGLGDCTADELYFEGTQACTKDVAGPRGSATATLGPENLLLRFAVQAYVQDAKTLLFDVGPESGEEHRVESPLTGKITDAGRKLRITIPLALRQPSLDASLTGLSQTFNRRKGKKYLVSSTGCKGGKHRFGAKLTFSERLDRAPVPPPVSSTTTARCSK